MSEKASVEVENLGGIERAELEFEPGLTVLSGENATNRTSFLLSLNEALGGQMGSLRSGAEEGEVSLSIGDDEYNRVLSKRGRGVSRSGNPYHNDAELVDRFVTLVERNAIRQKIEGASDIDAISQELGEYIMTPVDTAELDREKRQLQERKRELEEQLDEIEEAKKRLPQMEEKRQRLKKEIEELEEKHQEKRAEIEEIDIEREEEERAQDLMRELKEKQDEYNTLQEDLENKKELIESDREGIKQEEERLEEIEAELEELEGADEEEISNLQDRRDQVEAKKEKIASLVRVGDTFLRGAIPEELQPEDEDITSDLLSESEHELECPLCGDETQQGHVEERVDYLRELEGKYNQRSEELKSEIDELRSQQQELKSAKSKRQGIINDIDHAKERIEDRESEIEEMEDNLEEIEAEIDDLKEQVEETEELRDKNVVELHEAASDLDSQLRSKRNELESVKEQISELDGKAEDEDELKDERDDVNAKLEDVRGRVRSLERTAKDAMTSHMDELLDILGYENIERVRVDLDSPDDPTELSGFKLVVSRKSAMGGVAQEEQDITTLSESERSLIGLVFAVAGYVTHDVGSEVPFMLIDSVEQFDADRISKLLDYVTEEVGADYLVAALLPEDADAIGEKHASIPANAMA